MNNKFWAITTFFNPAKYKNILANYFTFAEALKKQGVNLLTVEMAFGENGYEIPDSHNVVRLRGNSVMWQKERLINYGVSQLPTSCEYFGWLDCDVLFADNNWVEMAVERFKKAQIIQLFKRINYLPRGHRFWKGEKELMLQGVIWQRLIHQNWLERRVKKELPFSSPGFAWGGNRKFFADLGGVYDRNIVGSGDTFMVDCCLNSWDIHGYAKKFNPYMKEHMGAWRAEFQKKPLTLDYLPIDIYHLWHGSLKNRAYMDRHDIILKYDYNPAEDIKLVNNVWEWATDKPGMHADINQYFFNRQEDSDE